MKASLAANRVLTSLRRSPKTCKGADLGHKKETLHERISRRINKAKQQVKYQAKLYNKQVKARAITRTRVKQEQVIEYQVYTINIIEVEYKKKIVILKKDVMLL